MSRKIGVIFVILGAVLIITALLFFSYNQYEDKKAGEEAQEVLQTIKEYIPEEKSEENFNQNSPNENIEDKELTIVDINGYGYIGYISIPALNIELPVMAEWDYARLKIAPCRQFGSTLTNDLVIAGHNYKEHFGYIDKLSAGDSVIFTDMNGNILSYSVSHTETLAPQSVDTVQNSGYNLVIYTCTYSGSNRVAVFCET